MNQADIAQKINVSQQYISLILSGKRRPSWDLAKALAEIFPETDPSFWMDADPATMAAIIKKDVDSSGKESNVKRSRNASF